MNNFEGGASELDTGFVYCPYVPIMTSVFTSPPTRIVFWGPEVYLYQEQLHSDEWTTIRKATEAEYYQYELDRI